MKALVLFFLLFSSKIFGWQASFFVDASVDNIPASFNTSAGSLVLQQLKFPRVLTICNETSSRICVNNQYYPLTGVPPSTEITHRVPSNQCMSTAFRMASRVFISGCGSMITSGVVHGFVD